LIEWRGGSGFAKQEHEIGAGEAIDESDEGGVAEKQSEGSPHGDMREFAGAAVHERGHANDDAAVWIGSSLERTGVVVLPLFA